MDVTKMYFDFHDDGADLHVAGTNGPIEVRFTVIPDFRAASSRRSWSPTATLRFSEVGSNVTLAYEHLPAIALAAARWYRKQYPVKTSII